MLKKSGTLLANSIAIDVVYALFLFHGCQRIFLKIEDIITHLTANLSRYFIRNARDIN